MPASAIFDHYTARAYGVFLGARYGDEPHLIWVMGGDIDADGPSKRRIHRQMAEGLVEDGLIAQNEAQRQAFWTVRESIPEANRHIGSISSHDVSVPPSKIVEFISRAGPSLERLAREEHGLVRAGEEVIRVTGARDEESAEADSAGGGGG